MNITGQAQENREYVRRLLKERQPDFAVVLEIGCTRSGWPDVP